ncbi:MAG: tRNA (adenosine(37)-N6)-threonylcarbamoyltransferase complex transferase subunit TsaD [Flavobacteriales bacterium]|nr:tRNA (adenosine(37)-N6)-threonylcarbamoyltransferase complex transferase subunit TsaD [Flavobacteriales bacterium]NUQ13788.1 tRNA (adenosine(37)-N6)-threonylcarbamoyltransferase complex transferase subunit TsaD [Flavobacteriales bacterium]
MRILGIESSCDETAAAVLVDGRVHSNVVAGQDVHRAWGGVVPELASRAHQEHIVPVVDTALREAGMRPSDLTAVAFTQGPGLIGALHVGAAFAKSYALALGLPLVAVDHMRAHVLAHFIRDDQERPVPAFPFLNLTVSGGHTLIVHVRSALDMEAIGSTLDDAAGEAFDKGAKLLGLPYPGGPQVDALAAQGDARRFRLPRPSVPGLDMSFSGLKSAFRNLVLPLRGADGAVPAELLPHLCATLQGAILDQLFTKLTLAVERTGITRIGIAGGVSANRGLRQRLAAEADARGWNVHIPPLAYCTDNAAMVAMAGDLLLRAGHIAGPDTAPRARIPQA